LRLALKVDVDTLRGTLEGVPRIAALLTRLKVGATFYFSVGPDHTGRALKRALRPGFLRKVRRTSVVAHYGWRTLLYGTLLPGPPIGKRAGNAMRAVRDAGFEVGVHCYDHVRWQDGVEHANAAWTRREFTRAFDTFAAVFGTPTCSHAAAGWQLNPSTLSLEGEFGLEYASDTRGSHPFLPAMGSVWGECVQIPTTLPTLDELIGIDGMSAAGACERLRASARAAGLPAQVFTLHAELEGGQHAPQFEELLQGWLADGFTIVPMCDLAASLQGTPLPRHAIEMGEVPGRSGRLALQGQRVHDAAGAC
jgi:peptidoglycan/xylan/chitin deacetylase (PgdA/CDA1 family)